MKILLNILKAAFIITSTTWLTVQLVSVHVPNNFILKAIANELNVSYETLIFKPLVGEGFNSIDTFLYGTLVYSTLLVLSLSSVILGFLVLGKGRSLFERLLLLQAFALPKEKEDWGKIYDATNNEPIAFVTIRVVDKKSDQKIVASTITDVYGRYRIYINLENKDYQMQILAGGYKTFEVELTGNAGWKNLTLSVALTRENSIDQNSLRTKWIEHKHKVNNLLVKYIYFVSVVTFIHIIYSLLTHFGPVAMLNLIVYGFAAPWNTYVLLSRKLATVGSIIDQRTGEPIKNVMVQIFEKNKQILSTLSDERGMVRLAIQDGKYKARFYKEGYYLVNSPSKSDLVDINISSEGLITNKIVLAQIDSNAEVNDDVLMNPFQ